MLFGGMVTNVAALLRARIWAALPALAPAVLVRRRLRRLGLLFGVAGALVLPAQAHAIVWPSVQVTGPTTAHLNEDIVLHITYSFDPGVFYGIDPLVAHVEDATMPGRWWGNCHGYSGSCDVTLYGVSIMPRVRNPATGGYLAKYKVCDANETCQDFQVDWQPWPTKLVASVTEQQNPGANGQMETTYVVTARNSASSDGFPIGVWDGPNPADGGHSTIVSGHNLTLWDVTHDRFVNATTVQDGCPSNCTVAWGLGPANADFGPKFEFRYDGNLPASNVVSLPFNGKSNNEPDGGAIDDSEFPDGCNPSEPAGCQPGRGDPVNVVTGAFATSYSDLKIPGRGVPINLARNYSSSFINRASAMGNGWSFTYGMRVVTTASTASVIQENGSQINFALSNGVYTAPGRVQATLVRNAGGTWTMKRRNQRTFTFDASGRLTRITDLHGYSTNVFYPSSTTMHVVAPSGRMITFTLSGGVITSVRDYSTPARTVSYAHDAAGDLTAVVDALGNRTSFTYDGQHRLTTVRSPNAQGDTTSSPEPVLRNTYDDSGRVVRQTDPLGRATTWTYDGLRTTTTDPKGHSTLDVIDPWRRVVRIVKGYGTADAETTKIQYDPRTNGKAAVCDAGDHCLRKTFDSAGNVLTATDQNRLTTSYAYNELNEVTSITSPRGLSFKTTKTYNAAGDLTSVSTPLLDEFNMTVGIQRWQYRYGENGASASDLTSVVDPNGEAWTLTYDSVGDRTSITSPPTPENAGGNRTTFGFDTGRGTLTSIISPRGNLAGANAASYTTSFAVDAVGRVTSVTQPKWDAGTPSLHRTTRTFDPNGNLVRVQGRDGKTTQRWFDAADQLTKVVRPDATTVKYDYDDAGLLAKRVGALGNSATYVYDARDHRTATVDALGRSKCASWDDHGRLATTWFSTTTCASSQEKLATYSYWLTGRLQAIDYADSTPDILKIWYDDDGRRTDYETASGHTSRAYDSLGRLTSESTPSGDTVSYGYDLANHVTSVTYPGPRTVTRTFDAAGRMSSVTDWLSNTTTFGYDADSHVATVTGPAAANIADRYTYDADGAMTNALVTRGATTVAALTSGRDSADRVTSQMASGALLEPNTALDYNENGQLQTAGKPNAAVALPHDVDGHLAALPNGDTLAYDSDEQLCASATGAAATCNAAPTAGTVFRYDSAGDRIASTPTSGSAKTFEYDSEQRLIKAIVGTTTVNYGYTPDGLRASKTVAGATSRFNWDRTAGLPQIISDGAYHYIYGPEGLPIEQVNQSTGVVTFLHHDQLGTIRLLTSTTGTVAGAATFGPYGARYVVSGTSSRFGFAGQYADAETGLVYMRARMYDPATAQFLTPDPLVDETEQPYDYANGDPVNFVDPSGLKSSTAERIATDASHLAGLAGVGTLGCLAVTAEAGPVAVGCVGVKILGKVASTTAVAADLVALAQGNGDAGSLILDTAGVVTDGAAQGVVRLPGVEAEVVDAATVVRDTLLNAMNEMYGFGKGQLGDECPPPPCTANGAW